jgi:hypothetical protein
VLASHEFVVTETGCFETDERKRKACRRIAQLNAGAAWSDSLHALHSCDNFKCINPDHIYAGTHYDNMRDKKAAGRTGKGTPLSAEHRAKIAASHRGRTVRDEVRATISAKLKGRPQSEETRRKRSEALKRFYAAQKASVQR